MIAVRLTIEWLCRIALNIYQYGSIVYGTYTEGKSDKDFIVIVPDDMSFLDKQQLENNNEQYTIYTQNTWQEKLNQHDVDAIETYFLPEAMRIKETMTFHVEIDNRKIRESFSSTASNSWVKCKKKLTVEKDFAPRVGKKSLWHALRILDFGEQILMYGSIQYYDSMNHCYNEIVDDPSDDWEHFKKLYQPRYNALKTRFRLAEHARNLNSGNMS